MNLETQISPGGSASLRGCELKHRRDLTVHQLLLSASLRGCELKHVGGTALSSDASQPPCEAVS